MTRRKSPDPSTLTLWLAVGTLGLGVAGLAYARSTNALPERPADDAPSRSAKHGQPGTHAVTGRTVTIHRPRQEIYEFWRDFSNLSQVMKSIISVVPLGGGVDRWTIAAPAGTEVMIDTRIIDDRPGEMIAWRSVDGAQVETEGQVMFRDGPADRGTEVEAVIAYKPPAGPLGRAIAKLFPQDPALQVRQDLKRLKMLMETGEIATSANRKAAD